MKPPATLEEYNRQYQKAVKYFGGGMQTGLALPCPNCLAPEFWKYRILEVREAFSKVTVCKECGFSAKVIFAPDGLMEFVQTGGPDLPDYLPKMRRVTEEY